jgi:hypothetical protein
VGTALARATLTASNASFSGGLLGFRLAQGRTDVPCCLHGAPDGLFLGVFVKEQQDLAGRALSRIAILKPAGAFAEHALAAAAADLDGIVEHCPAILLAGGMDGLMPASRNEPSKAAQAESKPNAGGRTDDQVNKSFTDRIAHPMTRSADRLYLKQ